MEFFCHNMDEYLVCLEYFSINSKSYVWEVWIVESHLKVKSKHCGRAHYYCKGQALAITNKNMKLKQNKAKPFTAKQCLDPPATCRIRSPCTEVLWGLLRKWCEKGRKIYIEFSNLFWNQLKSVISMSQHSIASPSPRPHWTVFGQSHIK